MIARRTITLILSLALAAALLEGCGARRLVGSPIAKQNLSRLQVGKTTRSEVGGGRRDALKFLS